MKWLVLLALQVTVVFALATSCSITKKSGDFACTKQTDCNADRVCVEGFCVLDGTQEIDASVTPTDGRPGDSSNACPAQCTSCNVPAKSCVIDCANGANCGGNVACPAGWSCDVKCDTDNSCRNGVTCAGSTSCTVECSGMGSCRNVQCGTGKCDVECTGPQACRDVTCGPSCACDVRCTGNQSCASGILCTSVACRSSATAPGCTSEPAQCHSCM
ncbi:MAG: hypothetical protein ABI678_11570 [Kofleriaceae bacterium]